MNVTTGGKKMKISLKVAGKCSTLEKFKRNGIFQKNFETWRHRNKTIQSHLSIFSQKNIAEILEILYLLFVREASTMFQTLTSTKMMRRRVNDFYFGCNNAPSIPGEDDSKGSTQLQYKATSVTRLSDLQHFEQLFQPLATIIFAKIA